MADALSAAPESVRIALNRLKDNLAGPGIVGLILYGGLARGRFRPGKSDVNVLVVLNDASAETIEKIAPALQEAWRSASVEPMILTPAELRQTAEAFPTKFFDIKNHHIVLAGSDPFGGVDVTRQQILRRAEQELHNLLLRLRRRYVSIVNDPGRLTQTLAEIARPFAIELASLLVGLNKDVPQDDRSLAIYEAAATAFGLDVDVLARLSEVRHGAEQPSDPQGLFRGVLKAVAQAAAVADRATEAPA